MYAISDANMNKRSRMSVYLAVVLAVTLAILGGIAASTQSANAAGGSISLTLYYNPDTSQYDYKCVGSGFTPVKKRNWTCQLESVDGVVYESHSGTFEATYFRTALYDFKRTNTVMCVVGKATDATTQRKCN